MSYILHILLISTVLPCIVSQYRENEVAQFYEQEGMQNHEKGVSQYHEEEVSQYHKEEVLEYQKNNISQYDEDRIQQYHEEEEMLSRHPEIEPQGMFLIPSTLTIQNDYPAIHGLYKISKITLNSAPVYKKIREKQEDCLYLFLDSSGHWVISPDMGGNNQLLISVDRNLTLPPTAGWLSPDKPHWSDTGIRVDHLNTAYMEQLYHPPQTIQLLPPSSLVVQRTNILFGLFDLLPESHNDHPQYRSHDYNSVIFLNDYGVWMVGTSHTRNSATPLSLALPLVPTPEFWPEWEIVDGEEVLALILVDNRILSEFVIKGDYLYCLDTPGLIAHGRYRQVQCDQVPLCRTGLDEQDCPFYTKLGWGIVVLFSCGITALGIMNFAVLRWFKLINITERGQLSGNDDERELQENDIIIETLIDRIVNAANDNTLNDITSFDEDFFKIHNSPTGLSYLLGTACSQILIPEKREELYLLISNEEERLHQNRNMRNIKFEISECVRNKAGSNQATQHFIQHYTGSARTQNKILIKDNKVTIDAMFWVKQGLQIVFVILSTMILVKELLFCLFLYSKYHHLPTFLQGFIIFNFLTMIMVQLLKSWYTTFNYETLFDFKEEKHGKQKKKIQASMFLLSPFVQPMLAMKQMIMERNIRKDSNITIESPTRNYIKHKRRAKQLNEISHFIQKLRLIDTSLQSFPQLVMILTYMLLSQNAAFETRGSDYTFLLYNSLFTFLCILLSYVHWTDMMKDKQLGLTSWLLLFFSSALVLLGRLIAVVSVTYSACVEHNILSDEGAKFNKDSKGRMLSHILTLAFSILFHWIILFGFCFFFVQTFRKETIFEKFLHISFNSYLAIPHRIFSNEEKTSKSKETTFNLLLIGLGNICMVLFGLPSGGISWNFIPATVGMFSIGFHLAGCFILLRYYSSAHVWSLK